MPHPLLYNGTQDDDRTRSIDVVHIEPSIREGVHLVSSLYGRDASAPIQRYAPLNLTPPYIRGNLEIPNELFVEVGQWSGSPSPQFAFQLMSNGVDIPGANNQAWMSTVEYEDTNITAEVRGFNNQGEEYALTAPVFITLIQPIKLLDYDIHVITGLNLENYLINRSERTTIITGVAAPERLDTIRGEIYTLSGMSSEDRADINDTSFAIITGLPREDTLQVHEASEVAIINYEFVDALIESVPVAMNIKNNQAEMGTLGWTTFGAVLASGTWRQEGNLSWKGGDNVHPAGANTPYTYLFQDIPVEPAWITDVDAGSTSVEIYWYQLTDGNDQANVRVEFYSSVMTLLGSNPGPGLFVSPSNIFFYRQLHVAIPAGTRFVRVIPEFQIQAGINIDAYVDSVDVFIRKGPRLTSRSYGPSFNQWRIRFLQANTWSGTALSEVEFRASIGGADLATGGTPIFGSAGLGVSDANLAFDNLRNTGYWAGKENGVAEGKAWLGYNMGTPVRPREIDITARLGGDSAQVGREFMLEGSNDGLRWTPVQYVPFDRLGLFTSGQQKQIPTPQGAYNFYTAGFTGAGYNFVRSTDSVDNVAGKGNIWEAYTRLNITHLRVRLNDNSAVTNFNYRLQLVRINTQKTGTFGIGMVSEVLENISATRIGSNAGGVWVEHACLATHTFEVGDLFLIRFFDENAATNPQQATEGRTFYIDNFGTELDDFNIRQGIARRIDSWTDTGPTAIAIGAVNARGNISLNWTVDFRGEIF